MLRTLSFAFANLSYFDTEIKMSSPAQDKKFKAEIKNMARPVSDKIVDAFNVLLEKLASDLPVLFVIAGVTTGKAVVTPKDLKGLAKTMTAALAIKPVNNIIHEMIMQFEETQSEGSMDNLMVFHLYITPLMKFLLKTASSLTFYSIGVRKALKETSMKELSKEEIRKSLNLYYTYVLIDTILEVSSGTLKPAIVTALHTVMISLKDGVKTAGKKMGEISAKFSRNKNTA